MTANNTSPDLIPWDTSRATGAPDSKEVRSPIETITLARTNPGMAVLYSTGQSKAAARLRAKKIKRGVPAVWKLWEGEFLAGAYEEPDGTYSVRVAWTGAAYPAPAAADYRTPQEPSGPPVVTDSQPFSDTIGW